MSKLEIILICISVISLGFNVVVFAYARAVIAQLLSVSEELGDLKQMVNAFATHVKKVYELEMFYGDQTLEHLMEHALSFNEQLETFEYIYSLTEEEQETDDNEENPPEEGESNQEA
ncbi:hypothetical protein CMI37_00940 [Candidatus Pacearchaeota archaeon]|nr:hypothetical protein [Candidatus Pacearchaeota archaeon]